MASVRCRERPSVELASCDAGGGISYDTGLVPLADGGLVREASLEELIPAPPGTLEMILPQRRPLTTIGPIAERSVLAVALPAGYTRLLLPAYVADRNAPALPLFGYTFACAVKDRLQVAAMRTDESEDWEPRHFAGGELENVIARRLACEPNNRILRQVAHCSLEYACFTAQNVFLERGEAALPVSPKCNARCIGCISEQDMEAGVPSPQARIADEGASQELAAVAIHHLVRVEEGVVSFGQGCEGEPLLRSVTIARAIEAIRAKQSNGTINLNTNGSQARCPKPLHRLRLAGRPDQSQFVLARRLPRLLPSGGLRTRRRLRDHLLARSSGLRVAPTSSPIPASPTNGPQSPPSRPS